MTPVSIFGNIAIAIFFIPLKAFSKKYTKRYLSRRRFEKALGVAPTEDSSGDKESKKIVK